MKAGLHGLIDSKIRWGLLEMLFMSRKHEDGLISVKRLFFFFCIPDHARSSVR